MDKIEELATIDARDDFMAFDSWLERIKEKIDSIEFDETDLTMTGLAIFSSGVLLGTKVPDFLRWLAGFGSGAALAYSLTKIAMNQFKDKSETAEEKEALLQALNDYQVLGVTDELAEVIEVPEEADTTEFEAITEKIEDE